MSTDTSLKEGMEITKEELLVQGCKFTCTHGFDSEIFERNGQYVYWDKNTRKIWRILPEK